MALVDISGSIEGSAFREAAGVLQALYRGVGAGGRLGLVAFSDVADTILPPTAPRQAFETALQRYLPSARRGADALRSSISVMPLFSLFGGTSISNGLVAAERALWRAGLHHGRIYLVSDLQDSAEDLGPALRELEHLHTEGVSVEVVKLGHGRPTLKLPAWVSPVRPDAVERAVRSQTTAARPSDAAGAGRPVALIVLAGLVAFGVAGLALAFPRIHPDRGEVAP